MKIQARMTFKLEKASRAESSKFNKPYGIIKVLDSDGFTQCFAYSIDDARKQIADILSKSTGLDDIEVVNVDE